MKEGGRRDDVLAGFGRQLLDSEWLAMARASREAGTTSRLSGHPALADRLLAVGVEPAEEGLGALAITLVRDQHAVDRAALGLLLGTEPLCHWVAQDRRSRSSPAPQRPPVPRLPRRVRDLVVGTLMTVSVAALAVTAVALAVPFEFGPLSTLDEVRLVVGSGLLAVLSRAPAVRLLTMPPPDPSVPSGRECATGPAPYPARVLPVDFRDVTAEAPPLVHFPGYVREFEENGFVALGRMPRVITPGGHGRATRAYARRHRATFLAMTAVPPVVLAVPDQSAFVLVDWWWGMPEVRLRTLLSTGVVVETRRAWDAAPVWRRDVQRGPRHLVLAEEQRLADAPGRSVDVVVGEPTVLWQVHRARVASYVQLYGGQPVVHQHMDQALALSRRLAAHDLQVERRRAAVTLGVAVAYIVVLVLALVGVIRVDSMTVSVLGWCVALPAPWLPRMLTRRVRYSRGHRPRFA